ncbi:hypothetical protein J31TS4_19220 [Paenibacillus sp. J31TS4]|uniref:phage head closure protein n=1 Tax=Paenibacillus sp. J31TS4 TaxID=2807195 RepID=UPI001B0A8187|nr:phage head closure protein [Paenibacillus sp. J31TS4]GIP38642.1 hypothetical protein J31TS4_19220 [Paenibacillus sp. J31TS4]
MNPGKLRHRISIERYEQDDDGAGGRTRTWKPVASVWANAVPLKGRELVEAQQTQSEFTMRFEIRPREDIDSNMRIRFKNRVFQIVSPPINVEERDREMLLMCKELSGDE